MLAAIRSFIQTHHMVTPSQLKREFEVSEDTLEPILNLLIARQEVQKVDVDYCKKDCQDCETPVYYEWVNIKR